MRAELGALRCASHRSPCLLVYSKEPTIQSISAAPSHRLLQVSAELIPESSSKVKVQFKEFKLLGLIPVKAPASATGELEVTYLDEELRVSRSVSVGVLVGWHGRGRRRGCCVLTEMGSRRW